MSDNYEGEFFDKGSSNSLPTSVQNSDSSMPNQVHNLKLSIDLLSVRNMTMASNIFIAY
jgi:hypothetical protein